MRRAATKGNRAEVGGLRIAYLGSGSKGNSALIEAGRTSVMLDCGFSTKETLRRLERLGRAPETITAILVTHEHSDHVSGVARLARRFNIPVWLTAGTLQGCPALDDVETGIINPHQPLVLGDLEITPMPVPHDAREPCQFVFDDGSDRLGVMTDIGHVTAHVVETLAACTALAIEANHDVEMLTSGPYPYRLKQRVGGRLGHLNNQQTGNLLKEVDTSRLRWVAGVHLSDTNNTPELASMAMASALECEPEEILIAGQESGLDWQSVA
ncbi:MAG: MBL fold metallo-hydrolase [Proteobacteria bacterium]|nr:MBL fold metallo-hydrolase [Pseudomonadota bacterium]